MYSTNIAIAASFIALFAVACSSAPETTPDSDNKAGGANSGESADGAGKNDPASPDAPGGPTSNPDAPKTPGDSTAAPVIGGCDTAPPKGAGQITSSFTMDAAPTPKGGDEKGTWLYSSVTVFLPSTAGAVVNVKSSKIEGTGFLMLDGKRFFTGSDMTNTISTRISGTVVSSGVSKSAGTYTYKDGKVTIVSECSESTAKEGDSQVTGSTDDMGFTRVSATEALVHMVADTPVGKAHIVTKLTKAN